MCVCMFAELARALKFIVDSSISFTQEERGRDGMIFNTCRFFRPVFIFLLWILVMLGENIICFFCLMVAMTAKMCCVPINNSFTSHLGEVEKAVVDCVHFYSYPNLIMVLFKFSIWSYRKISS